MALNVQIRHHTAYTQFKTLINAFLLLWPVISIGVGKFWRMGSSTFFLQESSVLQIKTYLVEIQRQNFNQIESIDINNLECTYHINIVWAQLQGTCNLQ